MTHLLHCCSTQSLSDAQPPPLTAVWDPPMELLGGQGQHRVTQYQQSPLPSHPLLTVVVEVTANQRRMPGSG